MEIRALTPADLPQVAAIWNPIIRETAITFTPIEKTPQALDAWLAEDGPHLGAFDDAGRMLAWAAAHPFRPGPGYRFTWEHSIHAAPAARGTGVAAPLLEALIADLRARGVRSVIGAITASNARSLAFHARHGFQEVGRIPDAGWKLETWHDLVLMQRLL